MPGTGPVRVAAVCPALRLAWRRRGCARPAPRLAPCCRSLGLQRRARAYSPAVLSGCWRLSRWSPPMVLGRDERYTGRGNTTMPKAIAMSISSSSAARVTPRRAAIWVSWSYMAGVIRISYRRVLACLLHRRLTSRLLNPRDTATWPDLCVPWCDRRMPPPSGTHPGYTA